MAGFLAGIGTASYNGVTFPNQISTQINSRAVRDSSNRYTKYVEHNITIEFIIHDGLYALQTGTYTITLQPPPGTDDPPGDTTDEVYQEIRRRLLQSGGVLIFKDKGFGGIFTIDSDKQDVAFGPTPEVLSWESVGSNKAIRVIWSCTVTIAECKGGGDGTSPLSEKLAELNYSLNWDIDEAGLTRRTVNGMMELAMSRPEAAVRGVATVDEFRGRIHIDVPLGFKRSNQSWTVSPDRRFLNFSITDQEIPSDNPLYPGVIHLDIDYSFSNTSISFSQWNVTLSGTISVVPEVPQWFAWAAFILVVKSKRAHATKARVTTIIEGQRDTCPGGIVLTRNLSISSKPYGRDMSFSLTWLLSCTLDSLFAATGIWEPVLGTSWQAYRTSMTRATRTWDKRGHARMRDFNEGTIVNICEPGTQHSTVNAVAFRNPIRPATPALFTSSCPLPETSWLVFQNEYELIRDTGTYSHVPLSKPERVNETVPTAASVGYDIQGSQTNEPVTQRRTQSKYMVRMKGWAMRVCHHIPPIRITKYGGIPVTLIGDEDQSEKLLSTFDLPVYIARWDKLYSVNGTPSGDLISSLEIKEGCLK